MAIAAVLSIDNSAIQAGLPCRFTLVVSNTGGSAVSILHVNPSVDAAGDSFAQFPDYIDNGTIMAEVFRGQTSFAPGALRSSNQVIPAGGSVTLGWTGTAFAGTGPQGLQQPRAYPASVVVWTSDGSVTQSNTVTFTVSPAYAGGGLPGAYPATPVVGQARFESNIVGSSLVPVMFPTPA